MKLDKSKKYIIMGVAHSGTCSFERYLVKLGYDVIRAETAYRERTPTQYAQIWSERQPLFIISTKTTHVDVDFIYRTWLDTDPIIFHLNDLKVDPKFPWENKGNKYTIRPDYHKYESGFKE